MKTIPLILLGAALTLAACSSKDNQRSTPATNVENETELASDDEPQLPERSDFTFATDLHVSSADDPIADSIVVHIKLNGKEHLTLGCTPIPLDTTYWTGFGDIIEDDINFDGIADLRVCLGPSNYFGNFVYDAWLWNPKTHKFDFIEEFNEITDPELDPENMRIKGSWRLDNEYEESVYKWEKGKLVKESSKTIDLNEIYEE